VKKFCQNAAQPVYRTRLGDNHPPNKKYIVPAFFGDEFVEQDGSLAQSVYRRSKRNGGILVYLSVIVFDKKNFLKNYTLVFSILILVQ